MTSTRWWMLPKGAGRHSIRAALLKGVGQRPHVQIWRLDMPKLILLALVLASLGTILACSRDEPAPPTQPAREAAATAAPTATAQPTATPQEDSPEPDRDEQPSAPGYFPRST